MDRLKAAFGFADPAPTPTREEKKTTTVKPRTGETLNPEAVTFVTLEGITAAKSRAGRPLRPPVRFGA